MKIRRLYVLNLLLLVGVLILSSLWQLVGVQEPSPPSATVPAPVGASVSKPSPLVEEVSIHGIGLGMPASQVRALWGDPIHRASCRIYRRRGSVKGDGWGYRDKVELGIGFADQGAEQVTGDCLELGGQVLFKKGQQVSYADLAASRLGEADLSAEHKTWSIYAVYTSLGLMIDLRIPNSVLEFPPDTSGTSEQVRRYMGDRRFEVLGFELNRRFNEL